MWEILSSKPQNKITHNTVQSMKTETVLINQKYQEGKDQNNKLKNRGLPI